MRSVRFQWGTRWCRLFPLASASIWVNGCATIPRPIPPTGALATFLGEDSGLRVRVYSFPRTSGRRTAARSPSGRWSDIIFGPPRDTGVGGWRTPQGLVGAGGKLWVCDAGFPDVLEVDFNGGRIRRWTNAQDRPYGPTAIAPAADGSLFVVDSAQAAVRHYGFDGRLIRSLIVPVDSVRASAKARPRPSGVTLADDVVYVADAGLGLVHRFDVRADQWLSPWGTGENGCRLAAPTGLAVGVEHDLLVVDSVLGLVHRFSLDGRCGAPIGRPGLDPGALMRPLQVAVLESELILVTDAVRQAVVVFDSSGRFVLELAGPREGWAGFTMPTGVAVLDDAPVMPPPPAERDFASDGSEWALISDTLGSPSLTLLEFESNVVVR